MNQCGTNTSQIEKFTTQLKNTGDFNTAFSASETLEEAADFVNFNFKIICGDKDYLQSAIFTFGR